MWRDCLSKVNTSLYSFAAECVFLYYLFSFIINLIGIFHRVIYLVGFIRRSDHSFGWVCFETEVEWFLFCTGFNFLGNFLKRRLL